MAKHSRQLPLRARLLIGALDAVTWPVWWLLDRGTKRDVTR